jgi:eukaryotic-like serine/threonine-protein kinase
MELVEGRPLDEVLRAGGRMPCERVLALGLQLADALGFAHAQGIVHRDVKPSNVLLSHDGRTVKLLDFGVARVGDGPALDRTQVGQMIGTPRYMSPEQALGLPVDRRADLFSLGVLLYEMVTGQVAFSATGIGTLAIQIAQEQPPAIERVVRDCPKGLRFIIERLLAKKPEARFADAAALSAAMRRELDALSVGDAVASRRRGVALRFKLPLILAGTTAVALAGCVWTVNDREKAVLERMAVTSGSSITAFVTSNAALRVADNAGLPPEQQDWAPLQAFVDAAARDREVKSLVVADASGTVRAAGDHRLIGHRYAAPAGEAAVASEDGAAVTAAPDGFRFRRPIRYAGAEFGRVDLVVRRDALDAANATARALLVALSVIVMLVVAAIGYASAAMIARPLRRLRKALDEAAQGDLAFRISHHRSDEFGQAFDAFNRAADALEPRLAAPVDHDAIQRALSETRVASPAREAA